MKRFRFSMRLMLLAVSLAALFCWATKEGVRQKQIVERIMAQGGTAYWDMQASFASGDSIVHHSLHPLKCIALKCTPQYPVDMQVESLKGIRELNVLNIQAMNPYDSALTDSAAKALLASNIKLNYLTVDGATCTNAMMLELRDKMPDTKGWLRRKSGYRMAMASKGARRVWDDVLFRASWD